MERGLVNSPPLFGTLKIEYFLEELVFDLLLHLTDVAVHNKDNWTVRRQSNYGFAGIACDQTIEQTLYCDSKMQHGLVGMALNREAMHWWITAQAGRGAIARQCEGMANVTTSKR